MKLIGHRWQDQGGNCQHEQHSDHAGCVASELQHAVTDTARYYGSTEYQDCGGQDRADQRGLNKLHGHCPQSKDTNEKFRQVAKRTVLSLSPPR